MVRTVLCYGDSNTHGTPPVPALGASGRYDLGMRWPGLMGAYLGASWHVIEEGLPGRTTVHDDPIEGDHRNGLSVLPAILHSHLPIDLIVLKLGTNDLKPRFSVGPMDIALSLERLITTIRANGCGPNGASPRILLVAPPPIEEVGVLAEMFAGGAAKSQQLGGHLARAATRADVHFVDAGLHIAVSPIDGIHYDEAAHATLARVLARAVQDMYSNI